MKMVNSIRFLRVLIFLSVVCSSHSKKPDTLLCVDPQCTGIISLARTVLNYHASDADMISFPPNKVARVLGKEKNGENWKISVQNREGFAPMRLLQETKIEVKASDLIEVSLSPLEKAEPMNDTKDIEVELDKMMPDIETSKESITEEPIDINSGEVSDGGSEVLDEDEALELEMKRKGIEPVVEEPFVKKEYYKVGEKDPDQSLVLDKQVKLDVDELDKNETVDRAGENNTDSRVIEDKQKITEPTIDTAESRDVSSEDATENKSDEVISPTTPRLIDSDTQNISAESIEPSETVPAEVTATQVQNIKSANNVFEYDGTVISDELLEEDSATISLKTATVQPTPVEQAPSSDAAVSNVFLGNIEKEITEPPEEKIDSNDSDVNKVQSSNVQNATESPQNTDGDSGVQISLIQTGQMEAKGDIEIDHQSDKKTEVASETIENVKQSHSLEQNEPALSESRIFSEKIEKSKQHEISPPAISHKEESKEEFATASTSLPESNVGRKSELNDIFSPNYDPTTEAEDAEENLGNWYDGIFIAFESLSGSIVGLFRSKSTEKLEEPMKQETNHPKKLEEMPIDGYCEKLDDGSCPRQESSSIHCHNFECLTNLKNIKYEKYADEFLEKIVAMSDVVFLLTFTGFCVLLFTLGHYWIVNSRREKDLIFKLNNTERSLLKTEKECSAVKEDLIETRKKLASIADKTFSTDDMIKQCEREKAELQEQIFALKDELETAAEAGLELNKMVSELLNNQSGSDSIISSVEELQRQLNEQEETTKLINNLLAEKSRENSELQVLLTETNNKLGVEIEELLQANKSLKSDKENLETELKETINALEAELNRDLEAKADEINRLKCDNDEWQRKYEEVKSKWQMSAAKAEALEDSIKKIKELNGKDIRSVIEITDANSKLLAVQKQNESLKDELDNEFDTKKRLEEQIKLLSNELNKLRAEFNQNEKEKLEAQTRLDVLSNYFKEKESQLQKELSVKEALFMKQQGESTSTVERVRNLQDEIQGLKSQNDQLRAEIEAQSAAHKAQINAAESRAHDSWLAAKQAERRLEETKIEAAVLRKKLTNISLNPENNLVPQPHSLDGMIPHDAPSPIHMESTGSPLTNLPLPPLFMPPPPLIGTNTSAFMRGPPPPLIPMPTSEEMRPAPLGRLMSPPPNNFVNDRDRYNSHRYSPESRYDDYPTDLYDETENDYSPPRSPEPYHRDRNYRNRYSPSPPPQHKKRPSVGKGALSSGSVESTSSQKQRGGKV